MNICILIIPRNNPNNLNNSLQWKKKKKLIFCFWYYVFFKKNLSKNCSGLFWQWIQVSKKNLLYLKNIPEFKGVFSWSLGEKKMLCNHTARVKVWKIHVITFQLMTLLAAWQNWRQVWFDVPSLMLDISNRTFSFLSY